MSSISERRVREIAKEVGGNEAALVGIDFVKVARGHLKTMENLDKRITRLTERIVALEDAVPKEA